MANELTRQERLLQLIKKYRKNSTRDAIILLVIAVVMLLGSKHLAGPSKVPVEKDQNSAFTASIVGDLMFGRFIEVAAQKQGYEHLFKYTRPYFVNSQFVTGNFESPVVLGDYPEAEKDIHLKTTPEAVDVLRKNNFTVLNLANNHLLDYGTKGLSDTLKTFSDQHLKTVGAGKNVTSASTISYHQAADYRIATIGISEVVPRGFKANKDTPGIYAANPVKYLPLVEEARRKADIVIVHLHWGVEYDSKPSTHQKDVARSLIDAGATIVVGHHPHVLSSMELYKGGVILYSLGNFLFDQGWSRTRETALVQYKINKTGARQVEVIPLWIGHAQPKPPTGLLASFRKYKIVKTITKGLPAARWKWRQDRIVIPL